MTDSSRTRNNPDHSERGPNAADLVRLHFDPVCPWCWVTAKWLFRLEELGEVELDFGLFSLEIQNQGSAESVEKGHARSAPALRAAVAARRQGGASAVGGFYRSLGRRVHEQGEALAELPTVHAALADAGLDPGLADQALDDPGTADVVSAEHHDLVERTRSFGVPTIVLDDGSAIFGPVIDRVPDDAEAVELWRHAAWLARYQPFAELKRERGAARPTLPSAESPEAD